MTTAGEHVFSLHHVKDTAATGDDPTYFRPLEDLIEFDGQRIYQEDILLQSTELATSLSFRDAVALMNATEFRALAHRLFENLTKLATRLAGTQSQTVAKIWMRNI